MSEHPYWVTIHGERGREWREVLGTNRVPIRSHVAARANLPDHPNARIYLAAWDVVSKEDQGKILRHLAKKFGLTPAAVAQDIVEAGVPILADDCSVWIGDL